MDVDNRDGAEVEEEELLTMLYGILNTIMTILNIVCVYLIHEPELSNDYQQVRKYYSLVSRVLSKLDICVK